MSQFLGPTLMERIRNEPQASGGIDTSQPPAGATVHFAPEPARFLNDMGTAIGGVHNSAQGFASAETTPWMNFDNSYTFAFWYKHAANPNFEKLIGETSNSSAVAGSRWQFTHHGNGNVYLYMECLNYRNFLCPTPGAVVAGTWVFYCCRVTIPASGSGSWVGARMYNVGTGVTDAFTGGNPPAFTFNNELPLSTALGSHDDGARGGVMDSLGLWSRLLDLDEMAFLYNEGNGRVYADLVDQEPDLLTGLDHWYDLGNATGSDRIDAHGTRDLVSIPGTTYADSVPVTGIANGVAQPGDLVTSWVGEPGTLYNLLFSDGSEPLLDDSGVLGLRSTGPADFGQVARKADDVIPSFTEIMGPPIWLTIASGFTPDSLATALLGYAAAGINLRMHDAIEARFYMYSDAENTIATSLGFPVVGVWNRLWGTGDAGTGERTVSLQGVHKDTAATPGGPVTVVGDVRSYVYPHVVLSEVIWWSKHLDSDEQAHLDAYLDRLTP